MKRTIAVLVATVTLIAGCRSDVDSDPTPRRPSGASVQRQKSSVDDYVADVQGAKNAQQEADALRELRKHMISNGLTYDIKAFRTHDNVLVPSPSTVTGPLRAQMTVYRGRDVVMTFNFVPHDNRNLAILGE
jgi:hypothetical protein